MNKKKHITSIGGQAVIEGVMMKGPDKVSMSVRLPNGEIDNECWDSKSKNKWYTKVPIISGFFNFILMMILGYKCLMKSAQKAEPVEPIEDVVNFPKKESKLESVLGKNVFYILMSLSTILGLILSIFLFMWVPSFLVKSLEAVFNLPASIKSLLEGIIKIIIFVSYISLTSLMKEMKTLYKYHGAEHKSIACYEAGEELTVANVKKYSRFHPRCGTSFILIVLVISILIFSAVSWTNILTRVFVKLALMPVVVGISYEVIKITAKHENKFTKIFVLPGLWLQRITTNEPMDSQIEVAINALKHVIPENKDDDRW